MNKNKFLLQSFLPRFLVVAFLAMSFTSCNSVDKMGPCMKITVEMDTSGLLLWTEKDANILMKNACYLTEKILRQRLEHFGFDKEAIEIKRADSVFLQTISIWSVDENTVRDRRIYNLLQEQGQLEFWETYDLNELGGDLERLNNSGQMEGDTLWKYLFLNTIYDGQGGRMTPPPTPLIGLSKDTARVMRIIRKYMNKLPGDLVFSWMLPTQSLKNSNDQNMFSLIALKGKRINPADNQSVNTFEKRIKNKNVPALSGSIISDAKAEKDENSGFHIEFSMQEVPAQKWAKITKENRGKAIAIVFDGYVYSYPTVQSEITSGNCWVSGNFTKEEAKDMAAMLRFGQLPLPLKIVSQDYK